MLQLLKLGIFVNDIVKLVFVSFFFFARTLYKVDCKEDMNICYSSLRL